MALAKSALAILATGLLSSGAAFAEEQTLRFTLVVTMTSDAEMELASITDQAVAVHEAVGVAHFEDGRIAFKRFAIATLGGEEEGSYMGLSTYTFENGDALNVRFDGQGPLKVRPAPGNSPGSKRHGRMRVSLRAASPSSFPEADRANPPRIPDRRHEPFGVCRG